MTAMPLRILVLGVCLACAGIADGESPPMQVTTDTKTYCANLADEVDHAQSPSPEAVRLAAEGTTLCREGFVQGGLHRIRRALAIIREEETP